MKLNKWLLIIIAVFLGLFLFQSFRACRLYDKMSILKGKYEQELKTEKDARAESEKIIIEQESKIAELNGAIDSSNTVIGEKEEDILNQDQKIAKLSNDLKNAKTDAERVPILTEQVESWTAKFTLAKQQIDEKDKIIDSLNKKFDAQLKITNELRADVDRLVALNASCNSLNKKLEGQIGGLRFQSNIKTYVILGIAGLAVYTTWRMVFDSARDSGKPIALSSLH